MTTEKLKKVTIVTAEEWHETRNLYGDVINPEATHFVNRPVYKNRPPATCRVVRNYNTGNYHVFSVDNT